MKKLLLTLGSSLLIAFQSFASDINEALLRAKNENKPLIVMVTTSSCPYCKKMKNSVLTAKEVQEALKDKIFIEINRDKDRLPPNLDARFVPSLFYINPSGEIESERYGFQNIEQMGAFLKSH